jgi:hypothetical protein
MDAKGAAMATEMDGLPENVRAALRVFEGEAVCTCHEAYTSRGMKDPQCNHDLADEVAIIRAELLRLIGECNSERLRADTYTAKYQAMRERAEREESELAELKRKIAEAPVADVRRRAKMAAVDCGGLPIEWDGKRVALLPLDDGGEG